MANRYVHNIIFDLYGEKNYALLKIENLFKYKFHFQDESLKSIISKHH